MAKTVFENSKFLPLKIVFKNLRPHILSLRQTSLQTIFNGKKFLLKTWNFQKPFLAFDSWDSGECLLPGSKNFCLIPYKVSPISIPNHTHMFRIEITSGKWGFENWNEVKIIHFRHFAIFGRNFIWSYIFKWKN